MQHGNRKWAWFFGAMGTVAVAFASVPAPFPDRIVTDGKALVKNGEGLRTATFFNVKVYRAALYLPEKTSDAAKVLASKEPKRLEMRFLRHVAVQDMQKAWDDHFRENCRTACEKGQKELDQLKSWMKDANEGDLLTLDLLPEGVRLAMNGETLGKTTEKPAESAFANQLLAIWLGQHPPNKSLKAGLLGLE